MGKYVEKSQKTEMERPVERYRETPEEMELNGDDRAKLDGLMIEYAPDSRRVEQTIQENESRELGRKYTCAN